MENFLGVPLKCISHQNLHVLCGCWLCFFIGLRTWPSCFTKFANAFKLTVNILYSSYPLTLYLNLLYYHMHWLDSQVSDISFPYYMIQNVYLLGGGVPYKKERVLLQYFLWWTMPTKLYLDTWGFFKIPNNNYGNVSPWYLLSSTSKTSSFYSNSLILYVCISVLVLIGNKADLEDQKQVDENEARTLAENLGLKYFETSAFNGQNVSKSVEALLDQVRLWLLIRSLSNRLLVVAFPSVYFMMLSSFSVSATFCLTPTVKLPVVHVFFKTFWQPC